MTRQMAYPNSYTVLRQFFFCILRTYIADKQHYK